MAHLWFNRRGEAQSLLWLYQRRPNLDHFVLRDVTTARWGAHLLGRVYAGAALVFGTLSAANSAVGGPRAPASVLFGLPLICFAAALQQRRAHKFYSQILETHTHNRAQVLPFLEQTAGLR